jgi:hypothetical protein
VRVCVHRGECMHVYMSACVCTVFLKKKRIILHREMATAWTLLASFPSQLLCYFLFFLYSFHHNYFIGLLFWPREHMLLILNFLKYILEMSKKGTKNFMHTY